MLEILLLVSGVLVLVAGVLIFNECKKKSYYKDLGTSIGMIIYGVIAIVMSFTHIF